LAGSSFKQRFWHAMQGLSSALAVWTTMPLAQAKVRSKITVTIICRMAVLRLGVAGFTAEGSSTATLAKDQRLHALALLLRAEP